MAGITNPAKAIRAKCLDCCCGSSKEVEQCTCEASCSLWPFRFGKNPYRKARHYSDEQIAAKRMHMAAVNARKAQQAVE